jgi:hypothetical protein
MSNLRTKLIRLANEHPEFRPHLLPLLKDASLLGDDNNPFGLYRGHEAVTEALQNEIYQTASAVASSHQAIERLVNQNAKLGTRDSDSQEAIWSTWTNEIKKALLGK